MLGEDIWRSTNLRYFSTKPNYFFGGNDFLATAVFNDSNQQEEHFFKPVYFGRAYFESDSNSYSESLDAKIMLIVLVLWEPKLVFVPLH